jgi:hypothetical protein
MVLRCVTAVLIAALLGCGGEPPPRPRAAPPQLFLAGDGELWVVDVGAERVRRVELPQLAPGDPPHRIVRRADRLVVFGDATYLLDPPLERPLRELAANSWFFIPSAHHDRVWIAFLDPDSPATVNALRAVREMTVDGRITVPDTRPPGGRWPLGAVSDGLLFEAGPARLKVWDPVRRELVRHVSVPDLGDLGPTSGNLVTACAGRRCGALRMTDVRTGARRVVDAPGDLAFEPWAARFSPDGSLLGIPVRARGAGPTDRRLALVDVDRAEAWLVDGSRVPFGYTFVAWSRSGDHVFITGGERFRDRVLVAYRLGDRRASVIDVEVGDFYDAAAM